jgi:hypothetical protein
MAAQASRGRLLLRAVRLEGRSMPHAATGERRFRYNDGDMPLGQIAILLGKRKIEVEITKIKCFNRQNGDVQGRLTASQRCGNIIVEDRAMAGGGRRSEQRGSATGRDRFGLFVYFLLFLLFLPLVLGLLFLK